MDTPAANAARKSFSELLGDAASVLDWETHDHDALDRAEGTRYLARLVSVAVDNQFGDRSRSHPGLRVLSNGFGMDNPDNR